MQTLGACTKAHTHKHTPTTMKNRGVRAQECWEVLLKRSMIEVDTRKAETRRYGNAKREDYQRRWLKMDTRAKKGKGQKSKVDGRGKGHLLWSSHYAANLFTFCFGLNSMKQKK